MAFPLALAGGFGLSAASSIFSGFMGSSAAKRAAAAQEDAAVRAQTFLYEQLRQIDARLSPYLSAGRESLSTYQNLIVSPQERRRQFELELEQLRLERPRDLTNSDIPLLTGKDASARWQALASQMVANRTQEQEAHDVKIKQKEAQIAAFEKAQAEGGKPELSTQAARELELTERQISRAAAARGLFSSGATLEASRQATQDITARESQRQIGNLLPLIQLGQGSAVQQAQIGAQLTNPLISSLLQQGQSKAQGELGSTQAVTGAIEGLGQAASTFSVLSALSSPGSTEAEPRKFIRS